MYAMLKNGDVLRMSDGAQFPPDMVNRDYVAFLAWLAAGNTPAPAPLSAAELNPSSDGIFGGQVWQF
jgi:hypothetical protein